MNPYCPSGAANLGKGIGGILFSRFSRSSGHVGGAEEDSEAGASEAQNVASSEEGATVAEGEEKHEEEEEEKKEEESAVLQSTSAVMDSSSCEYWMPNSRSVSPIKCLDNSVPLVETLRQHI